MTVMQSTVYFFRLKPKIRKELIYCEHKSLQISRLAKLASFTVAGAMPQSANLLISCALHSHNDTSLRNLGETSVFLTAFR